MHGYNYQFANNRGSEIGDEEDQSSKINIKWGQGKLPIAHFPPIIVLNRSEEMAALQGESSSSAHTTSHMAPSTSLGKNEVNVPYLPPVIFCHDHMAFLFECCFQKRVCSFQCLHTKYNWLHVLSTYSI